MPVEETKLTPEQQALESAAQENREQEFAEKLVKSLDLPATLTEGIEKEAKRDIETPKEEEVSEEEMDKPEEPEKTEEEPEESEQPEEAKEESDDDLIPRSKVQKRFDEMTRVNKALEARLKAIEEGQTKPKDETEAKLENMSEDELKTLKRQVRLAQIENNSNKDHLVKLLDLEEKIDSAIYTSPQRFQATQVSKFNEAVQESASEIQNFDKAGKEIFGFAKSIFDSTPELQKSVTGQARAWRLAVDHYKALSELSAGRSKTQELERTVNTLKKKVSVDSTAKKGSKPEDSNERLFKKAKYGTDTDKAAYFRKTLNTDSFIPEEYMNQ